jgi:hypothetical protein
MTDPLDALHRDGHRLGARNRHAVAQLYQPVRCAGAGQIAVFVQHPRATVAVAPCRVCDRWVRVRADGRLRAHYQPAAMSAPLGRRW